jgi:hypothetical protein
VQNKGKKMKADYDFNNDVLSSLNKIRIDMNNMNERLENLEKKLVNKVIQKLEFHFIFLNFKKNESSNVSEDTSNSTNETIQDESPIVNKLFDEINDMKKLILDNLDTL